MATTPNKPAAPKVGATASTEVILGAGARTLTAATTQFTNAFAAIEAAGKNVLAQLNEQAGTLTLQIANGEERLAQLAAEATEARRRNKVEIELDFQADAAAAATKWASEKGKTIIDTQVYQAELNGYAKLKDEFATQLNAEVGKATGIAKSQAEAERKLLDAEYRAKEATNTAQLTTLAQQLADAREETKRVYAQLEAERQAGVLRAQAQGSSVVNVGTPQR